MEEYLKIYLPYLDDDNMYHIEQIVKLKITIKELELKLDSMTLEKFEQDREEIKNRIARYMSGLDKLVFSSQ